MKDLEEAISGDSGVLVWLVLNNGNAKSFRVEPFAGGEVVHSYGWSIFGLFRTKGDAEAFAAYMQQADGPFFREPPEGRQYDEPIAWLAVFDDAVYYVQPCYGGQTDDYILGIFKARIDANAFVEARKTAEPPEYPGQCTSRDPATGCRCVKSMFGIRAGELHTGPHVGSHGEQWVDATR